MQCNVTEPSMCGGNAALCQITFSTCLLIVHMEEHVPVVSKGSTLEKVKKVKRQPANWSLECTCKIKMTIWA